MAPKPQICVLGEDQILPPLPGFYDDDFDGGLSDVENNHLENIVTQTEVIYETAHKKQQKSTLLPSSLPKKRKTIDDEVYQVHSEDEEEPQLDPSKNPKPSCSTTIVNSQKRKKQKKSNNNDVIDPAKEAELRAHSNEVSVTLTKTATERSRKAKVVTPENVTLWDIFKQQKLNERILHRIEAKQNDALHQMAAEEIKIPFKLPLKSATEVIQCNEWIEDPINYQILSDHMSRKLKSFGGEERKKKFIHLLFDDVIFESFSWVNHKEKRERHPADSMQIFGEFIIDSLDVDRKFITKQAHLARRRTNAEKAKTNVEADDQH